MANIFCVYRAHRHADSHGHALESAKVPEFGHLTESPIPKGNDIRSRYVYMDSFNRFQKGFGDQTEKYQTILKIHHVNTSNHFNYPKPAEIPTRLKGVV